MRIYDETEQEYVEGLGNNFISAQEYLANHWIDVPDDEENGDMYDKIMEADSWEELQGFASGLGYTIEREEL